MDEKNPFGEIVGVASDVAEAVRETGDRPTVYYVHTHLAFPSMVVLMRTAIAPESLGVSAQQVMRGIEPSATVADVASMEQVLGEMIGRERFSASLLAAFSGFALMLTAIGIYGVLAYTVSERTREIGIRVALGAEPRSITGMFVTKALRFTAAGAVAGIAGALVLSRFVRALLFETSPRDPLSFGVAPALLICVALLAAAIPARRAARLNAVEALRME